MQRDLVQEHLMKQENFSKIMNENYFEENQKEKKERKEILTKVSV
jgi:hypothetical protein